jgi:hypothetical protein
MFLHVWTQDTVSSVQTYNSTFFHVDILSDLLLILPSPTQSSLRYVHPKSTFNLEISLRSRSEGVILPSHSSSTRTRSHAYLRTVVIAPDSRQSPNWVMSECPTTLESV